SSVAVLDESRFQVNDKAYVADSGKIELTSYAPNRITYESNRQEKGFAVFSEIYYPKGWKVFVDGKEESYVRVNYVLRGMEIPAGKHQIEWKFEPESYIKGNMLSRIFSIIIAITIVLSVAFEFKKKDK